MKIKNTKCDRCGREIRNNNFSKHRNSCVGIKKKKVRGVDYDPNWGYKNGTRVAWNKGLTAETDERVKKNAEAMKIASQRPGHGQCSDPIKEATRRKKISTRLKEIGAGGYRENSGRSKKFKVFDSFGNRTTLQSTYEYACFEILCELGIRWIRPKALKYNEKNYFADFYLVDFDVYLDTKNDYKAKQDEDKIRLVNEQNGNKVFILLKNQINKNYIISII